VAALRELAGGRADLLAEVAGILEGTSEAELDEPLARQAASQAGCGAVPRGRGRPEGDPGVDRRRPQARGRREAAAVLGRPAWRGSTALKRAYQGALLGAGLC